MTTQTSPRGWTAGVTVYLLFLVISATLGPLQFGYHLSELNAPQEVLRCLSSTSQPSSPPFRDPQLPSCIRMDEVAFGTVQSVYTLGGLIGALSAGPLSSKRGRLFPMRVSAPFHIFGSLMEALSPNVPVLAVGRFLSGIGSGASLVVVPIYISEIAPSHAKGALGAFTQIFTNLGILVSQILGFCLSYDSMWRIVLGTGVIVGVIHFILLLFVIESPEWLGANGRAEAAWKNIRKIRGGSIEEEEVQKWGPAEEDEHQSLLSQPSIARQPKAENAVTVGFYEVVKHPEHRKAVIAVVAVMLAQQLCGINSVFFYSVTFLSKVLSNQAGLITVAVGALNLIVTIACSPLSDKLGRKTCILASIAGMGINALLLALAILFDVKILAAVVTLLFVASFAIGLGPVPFILPAELVGPEAVGAVQSWALAANWIATFMVAYLFPILNNVLSNGRVFFVFTVMAAVFFGFISWWVPESKGKANADEVWGRERRDRRED